MNLKSEPSASVSVASFFLLLDATIWLVFAVLVATGIHPALPESRALQWVMVVLALLATGVLIGLWFFLRRRSRPAYYLTVASLFVLLMLTIADDVGLSDLLVLVAIVVPLVLLLKDRRWYLGGEAGHSTHA